MSIQNFGIRSHLIYNQPEKNYKHIEYAKSGTHFIETWEKRVNQGKNFIFFFTLAGKFGLVPKLKLMNLKTIENMINDNGFHILET